MQKLKWLQKLAFTTFITSTTFSKNIILLAFRKNYFHICATDNEHNIKQQLVVA